MTRRSPAQYSFSRLEFDETLLTKHFSPLAGRDIDCVVVHHMTITGLDGATNALTACYKVWQDRQASAHYGVQGQQIRQYVWDKDYAWATGSTQGNLHGISIEHTNTTREPNWLVSTLTWKTGAKLAAAIHVKYKLGRPVKDKTIRKHSSFTSTACPGPYLGRATKAGDGPWDLYVKEAQRQYDLMVGAVVAPPVVKPPVVTKPTSYKVVGGDTLWALSRRYDVTVAELAAWNALKQPYLLEIGQTLRLTKPASTPKPPAPESYPIEYISANLAGYEAERGIETAVARAKGDIPDYLLPKAPEWFHFQECSKPMLAHLDASLKGYKRVAQGGKGRESYYRTGRGIKILKAELRNVDTMLDGDTKEFLLTAYEVDGYRGVYANFHSENDKEKAVQLRQLREVMTAAREFADGLGIDRANIVVTGDANKVEARAYVKGQRWAEARDIAKKKIDLTYKTTNGWTSRLVKGDAIDVDVFQDDAIVSEAEMLFGVISDHYARRVIHRLVK